MKKVEEIFIYKIAEGGLVTSFAMQGDPDGRSRQLMDTKFERYCEQIDKDNDNCCRTSDWICEEGGSGYNTNWFNMGAFEDIYDMEEIIKDYIEQLNDLPPIN